MCRCSEEIAEPSLKKKSGSKPESSFFPHRHFDSFFSVLSEKSMSSFPMLISSCPGTQATRRRQGQPSGVLRVKAGDLRQGCVPQADARVLSGQLSLGDTENTREILAIPDIAQLHSQRHRF